MAETLGHRTTIGLIGAWLWSVTAFLGVLLICFGLLISDPIEPEDWLVSGVFLIVLVALPISLAVISSRATSRTMSVLLSAGGLLGPLLIYWIVLYG